MPVVKSKEKPSFEEIKARVLMFTAQHSSTAPLPVPMNAQAKAFEGLRTEQSVCDSELMNTLQRVTKEQQSPNRRLPTVSVMGEAQKTVELLNSTVAIENAFMSWVAGDQLMTLQEQVARLQRENDTLKSEMLEIRQKNMEELPFEVPTVNLAKESQQELLLPWIEVREDGGLGVALRGALRRDKQGGIRNLVRALVFLQREFRKRRRERDKPDQNELDAKTALAFRFILDFTRLEFLGQFLSVCEVGCAEWMC